jgi:hypothetical protein
MRFSLVAVALLSTTQPATAQHTFWLSREFLGSLERQPILHFPMELALSTAVGPVHSLADDCELHIPGNAMQDNSTLAQ